MQTRGEGEDGSEEVPRGFLSEGGRIPDPKGKGPPGVDTVAARIGGKRGKNRHGRRAEGSIDDPVIRILTKKKESHI